MILDVIKELHHQELEAAVEAERNRVHQILKKKFDSFLGKGQPEQTKLLLELDREIRNESDRAT